MRSRLAVVATLVLGAARGDPTWLGRALEARPLRAFGRISYGVYLYHVFLWGSLQQVAPGLGDPGPVPFVVVSGCALLVAMLSLPSDLRGRERRR